MPIERIPVSLREGKLEPDGIAWLEERHKTGPEVHRLKMEAKQGRPVTLGEANSDLVRKGLEILNEITK